MILPGKADRHPPSHEGLLRVLPLFEPPALELDDGFVVATGIECSAPTIAGGVRQDELRKTGHWERYAEDFSVASSLGLRYVRWGVPFHVVARSDDPREFDWRWTDAALDSLRAAGLEPILDLLHFGLPDDIRAVGDPRLIARYELFAAAVAERYEWARYFTPVNEPLVTAVFSASAGMWNERARDDRSLVAALNVTATCAVRGMELIRERRPDAIFIQSDGCDAFRGETPAGEDRAAFLNERRFAGWDLTYGRDPLPRIREWLIRNGMSEERLDWFAGHGSSESCIVGHDYYRGNEWIVEPNGWLSRDRLGRRGYVALARDYAAHFAGMPFMLSETNYPGRMAPRWLAEVWNDAMALRAEGQPIRGFCWYGLIDHVDWDSGLARNRGQVNHCGLIGLDRRAHRVGRMYGEIAHDARQARFEMLATTATELETRLPAAA
jgi:hypothetical protein